MRRTAVKYETRVMMEIILAVVLFLVGIVLIVKGGDYFVDAASWIAEVSGVPKLIVGATIVSLATTLPEMLVSVMAAAQKKVEMSIGNAVGSVTANIGLIMAISLLCMPAVIKRKDYLLKSVLMLLATGIIVAGGFFGRITLPFSLLLLVIFVIFIWENVKTALDAIKNGGEQEEKKKDKPSRNEVLINLIKFVVGAIGIVVGARLLVDNGSLLAAYVGVSERVIGVTLVAVGTSLPELVTTVTAVMKKQSSLSLGNILGANILDLTLILPLSALVSGQALPVTLAAAKIDLPVCLLVGLIAVVPALIASKFKRYQGVALIAVYICYVGVTCFIVK